MTAVFVPAGAFIQLRLDADKLPYEKSADGKGEPVCIAEEVPFELPKGWAWARLALLCDAILVPQRDKPKFFSGNIPWCRIEDIEGRLIYESRIGRCVDQATVESMNLKINPVGTVICSNSATIGVPAIVTKPLVTNQRFIGFVCRPQLLNWYLYDLFLAAHDYLSSGGTGSTQDYIARSTFERMLVPLPPLPEQRRIVAELDRCLSLVDTVERDGGELEALFRRLRSKVLDLAIRGELTERDPGDEPASELLTCIREEKLAMVARGELKPKDVKNDTVIFTGSDGLRYEKRADGRGEPVCIEDEIPFEIPETWAWARLGSISNYGRASSVKPTDIDEEDWVLDLEDIESGTGRLLKRVVKEERDVSSSKRHFDTGEVLYGKLRPYLNKILISDAPGYCSTEIMPIALYGQTDSTYILFCLMSDYFVKYANHCSYGMNMPRLGTKDGQRALIPIPPINEQTRIVQGVKAIRTVITNL